MDEPKCTTILKANTQKNSQLIYKIGISGIENLFANNLRMFCKTHKYVVQKKNCQHSKRFLLNFCKNPAWEETEYPLTNITWLKRKDWAKFFPIKYVLSCDFFILDCYCTQ